MDVSHGTLDFFLLYLLFISSFVCVCDYIQKQGLWR